jgi:hypothetical protein
MKNYIGKKIRGFRFEDGTDGVDWSKAKEECIGKIGIITDQSQYSVSVDFNIVFKRVYPISLIEPHLIEETHEIPQLGEGVLMEVSDNTVNWYKRNIIARLISGYYIDSIFTIWHFARPIPQLPQYTHAELVEKLGHDFEIIK